MPRVIVLDKLSPDGLALLEKAQHINYEVRLGLKGGELREALAEFDGAICRSGADITADSLKGNRRLKAIVRAGVGTDNIDKVAATRLGILVMNTPAGNTTSTAEHTIAMMLALSRNLGPAYQSLAQGRWERNQFMGTQLAGKTLGIIGLGRIGQAVAQRAKGLEMKLVGFDPFLSPERTSELGLEPVTSVHEMLPKVDYLTVHTPLTDETRHLIGDAEVELLRPGARLINCARGGIYSEEAILKGLKSGKLGGVALDVFEHEPCTDSPLFRMPNVLVAPHLGASTVEAQTNVAVEAVHLITDYLLRGSIRHAVNFAPLDAKALESLRGYLSVAHRLGLLLSQLAKGSPQRCELQYRGDISQKDTKLLSSSFAAGLLENALEEDVNIVNAEVLMRERGIELNEECCGEKGAFNSLMTATMVSSEGTQRVAGTLFGNNMPRLVQVGEQRLEAYLDGILLVFTHNDVPGIIGHIGTLLGSHNVNIAQMAVGRAHTTPGGPAVGVLNLDNTPPAAALKELLTAKDILSVDVVSLPPAGKLPDWLVS